MPDLAHWYAMPAPIMPAPSTTTFLAVNGGMSDGRPRSPLTAWRSKKNAWIMFLLTWPQTRSVK